METLIIKDSKSPAAESYRTLRTNIRFASFEKNIKTIAVTSAWMNEGKSTVTANLGMAMAETGYKVLLIDGDLRNPTLHEKFSLTCNMGITNILVEDLPYRDVLVKCPETENLHMLLSGPKPPNPSELLGSAKMRCFLEEMKNNYDYILIDTPPITVVTDAALIASVCDGVLLVIASGKTTAKDILKAKDLLRNVNANIIGAVLNKVKPEKYSDYYGYREWKEEKKASRKGILKR